MHVSNCTTVCESGPLLNIFMEMVSPGSEQKLHPSGFWGYCGGTAHGRAATRKMPPGPNPGEGQIWGALKHLPPSGKFSLVDQAAEQIC